MSETKTIYAADVSAESLPVLLEQPRKELKRKSKKETENE